MTIYEASGSELLNVLRGYWTRIQLELSERVYTTEVPRRFVREHRTIVRALERGDAQSAEQSMASHIEHGRRTLLKSLASRTAEGEARSA
jgi:DNA-binding GntR family transcriptional regulator